MIKFNEIIRRIASERNLTLFDYDKEVWSTVGFDYSQEKNMFRDWIHPKVVSLYFNRNTTYTISYNNSSNNNNFNQLYIILK